MKRSIAVFSVWALLVFALSCQKDQSENTPQEKQQEQVRDQEPVTDPSPADNSQETAAAAAAKVASPVPGYKVTYPFGVKNPNYAAGYHTGDDYASPTGSKVVAVRNGTIAWSNNNGGAYGRWIGLRADNGRDYVYCHLSVRSVSTGTKVVAGQKIGEVGATGNVTGPHLHFEDRPKGGGYGQVRKPTW